MNNIKFISLLFLLAPFSQAHAGKDDFNKEIVIVAKRQASDLKNKIASYIDDVKITQGSLSIEADLVQVMSLPDSDAKAYLAIGKPAKFTQTLDDGKPVHLQADEIKYQPLSQTVYISGNAQVSQEGSIVKGDKITYNIATEQLKAESSSDEAVTTILQPKKDNNPETKEQNEQ
jgi:lipopolysaccharide export system protein LptA